MKFRAWVVGALVVMSTALSFAQEPVAPVSPPQVINQPGGPPPGVNGAPRRQRHQRNSWLNAIGATPQQRQQIKPLQKIYKQQTRSIRQAQREQTLAMLSPQQLNVLNTLPTSARFNPKSQGNNAPPLPHGWQQAVGLTPQQRQQIRQLHKQTRSQVKQAAAQFLAQVGPLLNPDQRAQLDQYLQAHHGRV